MPLQNARTALELPSMKGLDPQVRQTLNDRMRTIAQRIDSATSAPVSSGSGTAVSQIILSVPGTLGVLSNAAPLVTLPATATPREVLALVKKAPQGANLTANIRVGGTQWLSFTIAPLQTSVDITSGLTQILLNSPITVDLVSVGTVFPGSDLSVIFRF
jgi:hypothetical protein